VGTLGALLALAALIAGCGGGGDSTTSTTSEAPLTKAEFIRKGDLICQVGNEASTTEIKKFAKDNGFGSGEPSKAQFEEAVTEVLVPNLEQQTDELDALVPPTQDEDKIEALIASLRETITKLEKNPSSLEGNALAEPIRLENAYGFKVCGGG
jgi:ornithine cyclodeaminase/alanine dehydrogenase-like protein (mu-crystallin family)